MLFSIVLIHELGHACVAKSFGWRVNKIELLPFGGVAEVDEHGNRSIKEETLVVIAGPAMNVIMVGFAFLFLKAGLVQESILYLFIEYNVIIFVFNLFPILPLDGGKLMQILWSLHIPYKKAIHYSLFVSSSFLVVYLILLVMYYPFYFSLWVIAIFLCVAQWLQMKQAHYQFLRFLMERYRWHEESLALLEHQDVISICVSMKHKVKDAIEEMIRHKCHYFYLISPQGSITHVISEYELLHAYFHNRHAYRTLDDLFG